MRKLISDVMLQRVDAAFLRMLIALQMFMAHWLEESCVVTCLFFFFLNGGDSDGSTCACDITALSSLFHSEEPGIFCYLVLEYKPVFLFLCSIS